MLETTLYPTVKRFLEELGFQVKGEVNGCDIVAVRDGEPPRLAIVEAAGQLTAHISPLTALQKNLLAFWELPPDLYQRLTLHFPEPPPI